MARVRLFASLREIAGPSQIDIEAGNVAALCEELARRFGPDFARILAAGSVVVDGRAVAPEHVLSDEDEVALLPPVSGGTESFGVMAGWFIS